MTAAAAPRVATAQGQPSRRPRVRLLTCLAALVVLIVGGSLVDRLPLGSMRDDAMYVILAKAVATGSGYRWINLPGSPAATHFPPGYPAVLAALWWLFPAFPANVLVFKLATVVFSAIAAFLVARLVRSRFAMGELGAQGFSLASMLAAPALVLAASTMSEPLFLALALLTLLVAERVIDDHAARTRTLITLGVLAGCTTLVRSFGVALIAATVLVLASRRRVRHAAVVGAVSLAVLLPWQLWVQANSAGIPESMLGTYGSYASWISAGYRANGIGLVARTVLRTTGELALILQYTVAPSLPFAARIAALGALTALALVGLPVLWRRAPVTLLFLGLYGMIMIAMPFTPGRYLYAVWPLVLLPPVLGARALLARRPAAPRPAPWQWACAAVTAALALGYATYNVNGYRGRPWSALWYARELRPMLGWIAANTSRDAMLATESEGSVYLYTGRRAVPVGSVRVTDYFASRTAVQNAAIVRTMVERYHPHAVIVSTGWYRAAVHELVLTNPPSLVAVDTFPGGGVVLVPASRPLGAVEASPDGRDQAIR